ncbi:MAG: NUDIX hydrolase [Clostridium argentinense]|uniref:NUDIX hydrolase n=1 Tax=Clostridium faecium TaxID=2762223 RepID=A0ABR8YW70_9CLOT|nr:MULTISPECIES: NUDIX hydrolase [Clostridium]MBD8048424.1 NUDIX hydrolase [Clostridium faecium]MBS5825293.1 NUDIX hydrolase [Clostridium argentinense]MDU1350907.1 NUDIX hydrolase [Clostridium argentinense]
MDLFEKTISKEYIYKGKILNLKIEEVELPNGKTSKREIVEHLGAVAILAFKDENTVILVEQFRKPLNMSILEIPAGKLETGEDPESCAIRELEEETGYKTKELTYLGKIATTPGFSDEFIHIFKAENLYEGNIGGDEDEFINLHQYTIEEIKEMIKAGKIIDGKTIAALSFL